MGFCRARIRTSRDDQGSHEQTVSSQPRSREVSPIIESNPAVMLGKPIIRGTRITVEHILEKLAAGETIDEILQAHPRLTRDAILAALEFGAQTLRADVIYPLVIV